jgi:D-serine deaminase-like pyridoxal phosphate-dependent protein
MTELQTGSYVFMDVDYRRVAARVVPCTKTSHRRSALWRPYQQEPRRSCHGGCGFKAFATDRKFGPEIKGVTGLSISLMATSMVHCCFTMRAAKSVLATAWSFIVPHCDPNVNLHDRFFCVRGDKVVAVWPVAGRGYS